MIQYPIIFKDFYTGLIDSIRLDVLIKNIYNNKKILLIYYKIWKYNILLLLFFLLFSILDWNFYEQIYIINFFLCLLKIYTSFIHLLYFMDLLNILQIYIPLNNNNNGAIKSISLIIIMAIFNMGIFISTMIINILLNFYYFSKIINFFLLALYHSFYCFNNYWQSNRIELIYRFDIYEKMWIYYISYGIIPTLLYLNINNFIILAIYNLYMSLYLAFPFFVGTKYPRKIKAYPRINLYIFSYTTNRFIKIIKYLINIL